MKRIISVWMKKVEKRSNDVITIILNIIMILK